MAGGITYMTEERKAQNVEDLAAKFKSLRKHQDYLKDQIDTWSKLFEKASKALAGERQLPPFNPEQLPEKSDLISVWTEYAENNVELLDQRARLEKLLDLKFI